MHCVNLGILQYVNGSAIDFLCQDGCLRVVLLSFHFFLALVLLLYSFSHVHLMSLIQPHRFFRPRTPRQSTPTVFYSLQTLCKCKLHGATKTNQDKLLIAISSFLELQENSIHHTFPSAKAQPRVCDNRDAALRFISLFDGEGMEWQTPTYICGPVFGDKASCGKNFK